MKTLGTSVRIALGALRVNRTRSALTMLGIMQVAASVEPTSATKINTPLRVSVSDQIFSAWP